MWDPRGIWLRVRRRSKPLGGLVLVVVSLLVWYSRTGSLGYVLPPPSIKAVSLPDSIAPGIAQQLALLEQRAGEGNEQAQYQAALATASPTTVAPIPVIIFTYNRPESLRQTIESVLSSASFKSSLHPIFISQDGENIDIEEVVESYGHLVHHLQYRWPGPPKGYRPPDGQLNIIPYLKISGHYQFALDQVMDRVEGHDRWDRLIMLEDDMEVAPDFFSYFRRMSTLFDTDPSLYCVSAWNDHGQAKLVNDTTALYRTDCFPGLGWMWSRERWNELREWTPGWWDDWLREPKQRKGRSCVFPEVSRVYTFGTVGTSTGWFFGSWLAKMVLNGEDVDWDAVDVEYLQQKQYDDWLNDQLRSAVRFDSVRKAKSAVDREIAGGMNGTADLDERLVRYRHIWHLTDMMMSAGLLYEHKAGVPRSSYRGVVQFRHRGSRIWLVPQDFDFTPD